MIKGSWFLFRLLHLAGTPFILIPMRSSFRIVLALSLISQPALAVKHIKPGAYPNAKHDMVRVYTPAQIRKAGSLRAAIISGATGPRKIAVIVVEFDPSIRAGLTSGHNTIQSLANIDTYFDQMKQYFNEASFGHLSLTVKFFGPTGAQDRAVDAHAISIGKAMEYYGCGDEGKGCSSVTTPTPGLINANGNYLIYDALVAAHGFDATLNSTNYDDVVVVHAGNGNETTEGTEGDIWSIFYSQDSVIGNAGLGFTEGDVVPETETSGVASPLGVMCHEYGHSLGLPDQYNTGVSGGRSVVGDWEIMDSGPFLGPINGVGSNPSHPGAWDKYQLGWATAQIANSKGSYSLPYAETAAGGANALVMIPVLESTSEYYLVEYRSPTAAGALFDRYIPGEGLLIWHIDDDITSTRGVRVTDPTLANTVNTGVPHAGISIVTANGQDITNAYQGGSGDTFKNQSVFTSPRSNSFNNETSGITLVNISGVGGATATFEVANLAVTPGQRILKLINYPNPAGKGYSHPSGEGHTTFQFQLGRPADDYQINIYTLAGEMVRKVNKDAITLNITRSADEKWVYEYDWDLKNGDGAHVAPGVYLYLIRADGHSKSNKAVIIR